MRNFTASEENYIKAIYHLEMIHGKVSTSLLSGEVQTSPASVTDMLKKLQSKHLVHYKPYRGFNLTETGNKTALDIIRKHRLWEYFLVNKLGFQWDKVHEVAEDLEHISSKELIIRLAAYLGNPLFDPHGDPIPDNKGKIKLLKQSSLALVPIKQTVTVSSVKNQSFEMLDLLKHYNIAIGSKIKVQRKFEFDGSVEIKVEKNAATVISNDVAINVYCLL
ncbi:MAG: metal-dependent transcriptional regulator [Ferruginibacter sp.]